MPDPCDCGTCQAIAAARAVRVDLAVLERDLGGALAAIRAARAELDRQELAAVEAARGRGWTWDEIRKVWGDVSRQAVSQRMARLRAAANASSTSTP